jgi:endonuclease-3
MSEAEIEQVFERLSEVIDPKAELEWDTPLDLLIAVVLSAQTTDKAVNEVTRSLWRRCRACEDYLALGEDALQDALKTIGLYRNKTRSVLGICRMLLDEYDGRVPDSREALERLPGVGRKSANVVLNVAFGQPTLAVDTHIFRVANRLGMADAKTPLQTEQQVVDRIPERFARDAHHYLLLHGRYTCKARKPECWRCVLSDLCPYEPKTPQPGE